jgi:DNA damage-binding protein 1
VSLMPVNTQLPYSKLVTVAYWGTNVVEIFNMKDGSLRATARSPPLPAVVRSLLLFNFGNDNSNKGEDYRVFLLAGLGDGSIATMMWKDGGLHDLKIVSLGHAPVNLTPCEVDGRKAVFAAGNRSTLFSVDKNRLVNSPVTLKVRYRRCALYVTC